MKTQDKILITPGTAAVVAVSGIIGYGLFVTPNQTTNATSSSQVSSTNSTTSNNTSSTGSSSSGSTSSSTSSTGSTSSSSYKDGTYTASSSYSVPHGGQNSITATVAISGGKITSVKTSNNYTDRESGSYIDWFDQEISSTVTGQSIGDVSVSRVGGASLTSFAFNDVLDTIRSQAKA